MSHDIRPLRVALDCRTVRWREGTGVARYRDLLAQAVARIAQPLPVGDGGDAAARSGWTDLPRSLHGRVRAASDGDECRVADLYRLAQRHFSLTGSLLEVEAADPPDIAHWSHPMPLQMAGTANLYTVHDLIPITSPDLTGMSRRRHDRLLRRLVVSGAHFVTVSETVRGQLLARYDLDSPRVTCCYQAVEAPVGGTLPDELVPGGYLLALGRVESRKNIERLLLAWTMSGVDRPLVLAGPDGHWRSSAERRRVERLIARPGVVRIGWQPGDNVAALLANARALLMPSLDEGFGLPAIEAMAAGVPAMVADRGAQAEIASGALQVDPFDVLAIAAGIARIDSDQSLRDQLVARGRAISKEFNIEAFAARLRALYDTIVEGDSGPV